MSLPAKSLLPLVLLCIGGCSDSLLVKRLYPPEVAILSPADGAIAWRDRAVEVQARVKDLYTDDLTTLEVLWDTDNGTVTSTGWAADDIALGSWIPARDGAARLSVLVVDADAQEAREAVEPWVVTNARPEVSLTAPLDGEVLRQDRSATLRAEASDDGGANFLTVAWTLDGAPLDGCDASTPDGDLRCVQDGWMRAGDGLELCVIVTDALGLDGADCVLVDIDPCTDADGDGLTTCDDDCDDGDAGRAPGLPELCDGVDNDCDGEIDEGAVSDFFPDADGDGFGDPGSPLSACDAPAGYVSDATDCDDTRAAINPVATEVCDSLDNDCDSLVDEGVTATFYADADGDRYGDAGSAVDACAAPGGYVSDATDCDDTRAAVNPVATEVCDSLDNDCDTLVDEGVTSTFYVDADGDLYGNPAVSTSACVAPSGYVSDNTDCDDADASVHPGVSPDLPDGVDSDCDGDDAPCGLSVRYVPAEYPTIQDAVDASCDGDRIEVSAGTYVEDVVVPVVVEIVGVDGSAVTTIEGTGASSVVSMGAGWLEGFTITGGFAYSGGGVYALALSGDWTGIDLHLIENESRGSGGGAYIRGSFAVEMLDCSFERNLASGGGGGLYASAASGVVIEDSSFLDNRASSSGGGLFLSADAGASAAVRRLDLSWNSLDGGGFGAGLYLHVIGAHAEMESITFVENGNTAFGGGAYLRGGTGTIVDVVASGNQGWGAGLFINDGVWNLSSIDIRDSVGLALFINQAARADVVNAVLAGSSGHGAWVSGFTGARLTLTNVDVVANGAMGASGVFSDGGGLTLINSTLAYNREYGIHARGGGTVTVRSSNLYANGSARVFGMSDPTGSSGNLSVLPDYISFSTALAATAWDLGLNPSSALIDAGDPSILDLDGSRSDIGAYGGPGGAW